MKSFLTILFLVSVFSVFAQKDSTDTRSSFKFDWNKIYIGGTIGAQFGTTTYVDISPLIGYRFTDKLMAGPGFIYRYYNFNGTSYSEYGPKLFARYFINSSLFAHVEYEYLNRDLRFFDTNLFFADGAQREFIPSLLVGGGYRQTLGERASLNLMLLIEVLKRPYSPYAGQPFILRIGFGF